MNTYVLESIKTRFCARTIGRAASLLAAAFAFLIIPANVMAQELAAPLPQSPEWKTIHDLRKTLAFDPFRKDAWQKLGEAYSHTGEYKKAEEAFLSGLGIDSKSAELWNDLGDALYRQYRYAESNEAYRKALLFQKPECTPSESTISWTKQTNDSAAAKPSSLKCTFSSIPNSVVSPDQSQGQTNRIRETAAKLDSGF